ncbi:transforming growth factor-beta receptor type 3-like protein [Colius striatus]|uniref:transforming growth factor-beta receptor type 3-like protein n=1 Tax=Colius striatus TaxID=57412 RepID=UPI002B1DCA3E|nr:transforming growth factor-beta receptor type 3-like protein [Colius striatus]
MCDTVTEHEDVAQGHVTGMGHGDNVGTRHQDMTRTRWRHGDTGPSPMVAPRVTVAPGGVTWPRGQREATQRQSVGAGGCVGAMSPRVPTVAPRCRPRLRLDVSASPEFPPAPGPRAVPAGGRVFVQVRDTGTREGPGSPARVTLPGRPSRVSLCSRCSHNRGNPAPHLPACSRSPHPPVPARDPAPISPPVLVPISGDTSPCPPPKVSLSRAPPGLGFVLRRCFVSPRSSPGPPAPVSGPGPAPRPLVVLRGGCAARGAAGDAAGGAGGPRRRLLLSFLLPPRFPEPLQFLHCRLRLCRAGGSRRGHADGLPPCRAQPCARARGGASGAGPRPLPGPRPRGRSLRTVTRPIVVTLGPAGTPKPGAAAVPFPPPPPVLRFPPLSPRDRPRTPPADSAVPPGVVAAVSFGAFAVGAALAGGLWFVHRRTAAPRRPPAPRSSSAAPQPRGGQLRTISPKPPPRGSPSAAP